MVMNNLIFEDEELFDGCVLCLISGISGLDVVLDFRVMFGVKWVFNSKILIKRYMNVVMEGIELDKKIIFENCKEYEFG